MNAEYDFAESQAEEMVTTQIEHDQAILSDALYCLGSQMTDMRLQGVDEFIQRQCAANQLTYPPQQMEVVCQSLA